MDRPKAEKVLICEKGQAHVKTRTHSFLTETSPEHLVRIVFTIIFPLVFSFVFARWWLGRGLLRLIFVVCLRVCHMRVWRKNLSSDLTPPHPLPTRNSSRAMVKPDTLHYLQQETNHYQLDVPKVWQMLAMGCNEETMLNSRQVAQIKSGRLGKKNKTLTKTLAHTSVCNLKARIVNCKLQNNQHCI